MREHANHLVVEGTELGSDLLCGNGLPMLMADENNLFAGLNVFRFFRESLQRHHALVHADRADNGNAATAYKHLRLARQHSGESVCITDRQCRYSFIVLRYITGSIADAPMGRQRFDQNRFGFQRQYRRKFHGLMIHLGGWIQPIETDSDPYHVIRQSGRIDRGRAIRRM
ncbi:hypothetical protein D1872_275300 [compost metagenome]